MGTYINPGNESFKEDINDRIYVDKTAMLGILNNKIGTKGKFVCISRPRRFGKTMASHMISAYYSCGCDSSSIFENFKIAGDQSYRTHLNKYNCLKLDIGGFWSRFRENAIEEITKRVVSDYAKEFSEIDLSGTADIADCIEATGIATKRKTVVIIDEYDLFMREGIPSEILEKYLNLLNGLFKNDSISPHIALAYLTGILPIIKELPAGKGYADLAFIPYKPNIPAMIIELKVKGTAETALSQIKKRNTSQAWKNMKATCC